MGMTRAEVAKILKMKPCTVESIERTAFKKILRDKGLCAKCAELLAETHEAARNDYTVDKMLYGLLGLRWTKLRYETEDDTADPEAFDDIEEMVQ